MSVNFGVFPGGTFDSRDVITVGSSVEATDLSCFLANKDRSALTYDLLMNEYAHDPSACLGFMSPPAMAFFLPAWMKMALIDYERADVLPEAVIRKLLALAEGDDADCLSHIESTYSREQMRAVAEFLQEMSSMYWHHYPTDDAKKALLTYWDRYLV